MRKKQNKKERAKIATVTLMVVSVLLAAATLAVAELKKAEKHNHPATGTESYSAPTPAFSGATASSKISR